MKRFLDRLSQSQRVVVVVATGLGLWVVGRYLVNLGSGAVGHGSVLVQGPPALTTPSSGLPSLARLVIWLALIGVGALAAIWVLQPPDGSDKSTHS